MYKKAYGIIETLAPLHVGATAGEESGNLNLIFRDQFTQTGIIPGSSIRGRLRSEMRRAIDGDEDYWYGREAADGVSDSTSESMVKFEYASLLWLPVFCPGQPIVWVSCPKLLKRYKRFAENSGKLPDPENLKYKGSSKLKAPMIANSPKLFFNFGLLTVEGTEDLSAWFPLGKELPAIVVGDDEISMIHDMALYRQSRVALEREEKKVADGKFFNTEALPEGTILVFPVAIRKENSKADEVEDKKWQPFGSGNNKADVYLGGLESIGFGHCEITLKGV